MSSSSSGLPAHCTNGKKDNNETGKDCGGPECMPCGAGEPCDAATDCSGGFCAQGICCTTACTDACWSCNAADTGGANGVCSLAKAGADPGDVCQTKYGGKCGAAGTCACDNGLPDTDEADTDCGGVCKTKCDDAKACSKGADCQSNACVDIGGGKKICCDQPCSGECKTCNLVLLGTSWAGQCVAYPAGEAGTCAGGQGCDATQHCIANGLNGSLCSADNKCVSGQCGGGTCRPDDLPAGSPCLFDNWCHNGCEFTTHLCK
ncbi:BNR repeat domain protein [Minicystis rosea]|nr:BNR repeat domain protein [Minicystis rosea]